MTALLLGGTGFVGRRLWTALHDAGYPVVAVARRHAHHPPGRLVRADLASEDIGALLAEVRPSVVVNAAGAVWNPTDDQLVSSNVLLVDRLLAALAASGRRPRLVQLGSSKEYGPGPVGVATPEDRPPRPASAYGRTKLRATRAVLEATRRGEADGVVLRLPTLIGPGGPRISLFGRICAQLAEDEPPVTLRLARLSACHDFLAAADLAAGVLAAAQAGDAGGRVVNLGYGEAIPVRSVVDRLLAESGVPATIVEQDGPRKDEWVDWQCLDITAAARLLGWTPRQSVREAMAAMWANVREGLLTGHKSR
jgi:NDP-hexose 4-ketoreductase